MTPVNLADQHLSSSHVSSATAPKPNLSNYQRPLTFFEENDPASTGKKQRGRKPNPATPTLRKQQNRQAQKLSGSEEINIGQMSRAARSLQEINKQLKAFLQHKREEVGVLSHIVYQLKDIMDEEGIAIPEEVETLMCDYLLPRENANENNQLNYRHSEFPDDDYSRGLQESVDLERHISRSDTDEDEIKSSSPRSIDSALAIRLHHPSSPNASQPSPGDLGPSSPSGPLSPASSNANIINMPYPPIPKATEILMFMQKPPEPAGHPYIGNLTAFAIIRNEYNKQAADPHYGARPNLLPTPLQMEHQKTKHMDPRINLTIVPGVRDKILIFEDLFDLNTMMLLLRIHLVCWGSDPTVISSWEYPESYFVKYWYLCEQELVDSTNYWRRLHGKPKIQWDPMGHHLQEAEARLGNDDSDIESIIARINRYSLE
ncbi:hypothetical protein BZG36_04435 [Bifiguratus adelaidae]|uniref:BZIP domain-containing protein n=1 Tax=Bifiguratus adelaidae TaxID=1938954 RepID=A0A261XVJ5_9FUNG|nr:hypothetical protein BZG36_04435 [Bifiguratus adelaidae]